MLNEIKWLCNFLNIPYDDCYTLELWKIKQCNLKKSDVDMTNISIPNNHNQQLTIFDFEDQIAI
ncbi:hypothetical protein [Staphylococcus saprophyticus]|uniref:hypothetical protein n=1 Tax=Staphylococcus saprophyticus TaxID=29385 RepID=UPI0034C5D230